MNKHINIITKNKNNPNDYYACYVMNVQRIKKSRRMCG